jgi:hypothetical protein
MYVVYSSGHSDILQVVESSIKGQDNEMQPLEFAHLMRDKLVNARGGAKLFEIKG